MIAPESGEAGKWQTGRGALVCRHLLFTALIFLVLELWRPCFCLTDDNLNGGLPVFTEIGLRLLHGQSPFESEYLFGGHYNYLRDATFFNWHPVYLLASLLAGTRFHLWIVDASALVFYLVAAAGFTNLAWWLRSDLKLRLSNGWITFFTLSFTYSVFTLALGASWLNYLVNLGALPWLSLGILLRSWRGSLGLITLFSVHQILGGHVLATMTNTIYLSLLAAGVAWSRRSVAPLLCWAAGTALAALIVLPYLWPLAEGFSTTARIEGVPIRDMQSNAIPAVFFPISYFFGMILWYASPGIGGHLHGTYVTAFASCAAAWCLLPALISLRKWRRLEVISLAMLAFSVFMMLRPAWASEMMSHLPMIKAMRWPFRELLQFQFFLHLFLVLRVPSVPPFTRRLFALVGATILIVPLFLYPLPPTFNNMTLNRELLFSGEFDRYWDRVRPLLRPGDRIAVLVPETLQSEERFTHTSCLLPNYNYAAMARVTSTSGYSHTSPMDQLYIKTVVSLPEGAYPAEMRAALWREHPELKLITLESTEPLRLTLSTSDGKVIDLTPYVPVPARYSGPPP